MTRCVCGSEHPPLWVCPKAELAGEVARRLTGGRYGVEFQANNGDQWLKAFPATTYTSMTETVKAATLFRDYNAPSFKMLSVRVVEIENGSEKARPV